MGMGTDRGRDRDKDKDIVVSFFFCLPQSKPGKIFFHSQVNGKWQVGLCLNVRYLIL